MKAENTTRIQFDSLSVNEAYARGAAAAFLARYNVLGSHKGQFAHQAGVDHLGIHHQPGGHVDIIICQRKKTKRE